MLVCQGSLSSTARGGGEGCVAYRLPANHPKSLERFANIRDSLRVVQFVYSSFVKHPRALVHVYRVETVKEVFHLAFRFCQFDKGHELGKVAASGFFAASANGAIVSIFRVHLIGIPVKHAFVGAGQSECCGVRYAEGEEQRENGPHFGGGNEETRNKQEQHPQSS